jgi:hypothetical protein
MDKPSQSTRDLARRLLAFEAASNRGSDVPIHLTVRVCEKLRASLTRFAGADGFASLLRRSLALARAEVPSLNNVTVKPDCSIDGLDALAADAPDGAIEATAALTTHLLGLLVTFIGEPLTLRLVREAWPDAVFD